MASLLETSRDSECPFYSFPTVFYLTRLRHSAHLTAAVNKRTLSMPKGNSIQAQAGQHTPCSCSRRHCEEVRQSQPCVGIVYIGSAGERRRGGGSQTVPLRSRSLSTADCSTRNGPTKQILYFKRLLLIDPALYICALWQIAFDCQRKGSRRAGQAVTFCPYSRDYYRVLQG
jgi:hypothetical protein